jgi:hypothetical protein
VESYCDVELPLNRGRAGPAACTGHIDEASVRLPSGHRINGVAAVLTTAADHPDITAALSALVDAGRPRLQHGEQVEHVVIESRSTGDKHDRRTRDRLRQSHKITAALRLDWAAKSSTPLVWLPDVVIGSYFSALYHKETQPWKILKPAHTIDVQHLR